MPALSANIVLAILHEAWIVPNVCRLCKTPARLEVVELPPSPTKIVADASVVIDELSHGTGLLRSQAFVIAHKSFVAMDGNHPNAWHKA